MAQSGPLILDRYEPLGIAGEGGFGTVEIAWDPRIQRKVAIKSIKLTELDAYRAGLPGAQAIAADSTLDRWHGVQPWGDYLRTTEPEYPVEYDPDDLQPDGAPYGYDQRAQQVTSLSHLPGLDEARTAAMLADPRIVTVYDFEIRGRMAYLIMEYVEGITLTKLLSDYADFLTLDMVTAVFDAMAGALSVAHKAGVLHLDIKPDNIIINAQGQAKVTDFGLATLADASGAGTTGGGTIGYMPLEQMRREHLDARTDEWSLASVTYEMLTGDNPFRVDSLDLAEGAILDAELVLPSLCWDNMDPQLDDVLFYALDPERDERYASVCDFAEEVDKFLGDAASGRSQLALVVEDALGLGEEDEGDDWEDEPDERQPGVFRRLLEGIGARAGAWADEQPDDYLESAPGGGYPERARRQAPAARGEHLPLGERVPQAARTALGRAAAAVTSGFTAWLALSNLPFLPAFGGSSAFLLVVVVAVVAAIGAIVPHIGALASLALLGIALIACGNPLVGAVLIAATALWWFAVGRTGVAEANVALSLPLLGAIGGSGAVPLLAGSALRLLPALATTALAAVLALVLGSLGSVSLASWDALAHADFTRVNATANFIALLRQPGTWATIACWLAAAAVVPPARDHGGPWLTATGVIAGCVLVIVGAVMFAGPSAPAVAAPIVGAVVLLAIFL